MSGCWVFVCGPSGAGKDSVLAWCAQALASHARVCFAHRLVTRTGAHEAGHDGVDAAAFEALRGRGGLAWHWEAHGVRYGIAAEYLQRVARGGIVVVNGSREHAAGLAARPDVRRVLVTAPPEIVARRLHARGREDGTAIARRMARNGQLPAFAAQHVIDNSGPIERAGAALRDYLLELP